jgi:hypothetical protein
VGFSRSRLFRFPSANNHSKKRHLSIASPGTVPVRRSFRPLSTTATHYPYPVNLYRPNTGTQQQPQPSLKPPSKPSPPQKSSPTTKFTTTASYPPFVSLSSLHCSFNFPQHHCHRGIVSFPFKNTPFPFSSLHLPRRRESSPFPRSLSERPSFDACEVN